MTKEEAEEKLSQALIDIAVMVRTIMEAEGADIGELHVTQQELDETKADVHLLMTFGFCSMHRDCPESKHMRDQSLVKEKSGATIQ